MIQIIFSFRYYNICYIVKFELFIIFLKRIADKYKHNLLVVFNDNQLMQERN